MPGSHSHDHSHHHDHDHHGPGGHSHAPPSNHLIFALGTGLNLAFVVVEVVFGLASHSLALLSDAGHNLSDVFGLLIAWGAMQLGKSKPTERRTYGLRRSSILAALANAILLLVAVGGILWESIGRIGHPEPVAGHTVIWVAASGVVINAATALLFMAGRKHDLNVRGAFLHMAADAGVSLGVVVAGFVIGATGWLWLDPAVSIAIGLVIVWSTWGLLRESVNLAMDAVPEGIDYPAVKSFLTTQPGVSEVHDLHIWGMSTTETALTVHLIMPVAPCDGSFLHHLCHELESQFGIHHATVQIEFGDVDCHQAPDHVV